MRQTTTTLGTCVLLAAMLTACQATRPGGTPTPGASGAIGGGQIAGTPAAAPHYGAFGPIKTPSAIPVALALKSAPVPGGDTFADLERDNNGDDDFDPEVPVIFSAEGYGQGLTTPNGTLEIRGRTTRQATQKSWHIALNKDAPLWQDDDDILLNKHPYEMTRVRNKLAMDLFTAIPELSPPTTEFATLTIDGADMGLFTRIERTGKRFLKRRGLDDKGMLYKANQFEFHVRRDEIKLATDPGYDQKAFEKVLQIETGKDHTKLRAMLDALNDESKPINQVIDTYFDRANYITWLAVNIATRNLDTNSQNFLLYTPSGPGPFRFMPWDYDDAWGATEQPVTEPHPVARWHEGLANWWGVVLHRRFMQDPENLRQLLARVDELEDGFFTQERMKTNLDAYRSLVRAQISKSPDKDQLPVEGGVAAFDSEYARLLGSTIEARSRFRAALERPMPVYLGDPEKLGVGWVFNWDASYDLQGDKISYDFAIARDPDFKETVFEKKGLTDTTITVNAALPPGQAYFRVIVRDAKDPQNNWQIPFDSVDSPEGNIEYHGLKAFTIQ